MTVPAFSPAVTSRSPTAPAVAALACLSGGATLAGEALGARALRPMLGSTALAQVGTLAGVLGALGLGAWWAGRGLADGRHAPRRVLTHAHAGLAAWALLGALAPALFTDVSARALVPLSERAPLLGDLARFALAVALTAVPGALAGAVYPAAVALLGRGAGAGTALVGAASSLGAAAAALVTTFLVCPWLGVSRTLVAVAAAYALVALAASRVDGSWAPAPGPSPTSTVGEGRDDPRAGKTKGGRVKGPVPATPSAVSSAAMTSPPSPTVDEGEGPGAGAHGVLAATLLLGVASTAWQVLLARAAALSFGPSAFAFAAALAAHVTALALGELAALGRASRADAVGARASLGAVAFAASALAALSAPLLAALPGFSERLLARGAPPQHALWLAAYGALVVAALPVVGCVGAGLALGARALAGDGASRGGDGAANGSTLAAAAAGNVAGAVLTSFGAMPALGVTGAALAVAFLLAGAAGASRSRAAGLAAAAVAGLVALRTARAHDPAEMLGGPFLYAGGRDVELGNLAWRRDGPEATVAVRRDDEGNVLLQINGKVDATSLGDATTQTVVGAVPVAMARDPRDVLVVGLGSGMTADAARSVPGVRSVTVAELVRDVGAAARRDFARANHRVLEDPRVRLVEADAAHYLRGTSRTFDAIVSEPSNPWVAGMSDLFTREAFEAARARLRPGGAFGAWFHAYGTSAAVVASIVATFREVFPRATLMEVSPGQDYLLVGLREPARLDLDAFLRRVEDPTVARMFAAAGLPDRASVMARFLAGASGVEAIGRGAPTLRAADLTLEFLAPSLLYRDATADVFALLARVDDLPLAGLGVDASPGGTWLTLLDASEPRREAAAHARAMVLADRRGDAALALREGELALGLDPRDPTLRALVARLYIARARARLAARDPGGAEDDLTSALELSPPPTERLRALARLGDLALRRRDGRRALARYTEALTVVREARETAPELHVRMAEALALLGAPEQATEELDAAIRQTPDGPRRRELEALRSGATPRRR